MKMYCQRKMLFGNSYFDLFYNGSFFFINDMGANLNSVYHLVNIPLQDKDCVCVAFHFADRKSVV